MAGQRPRAEHRHAALALDVAHRHLSLPERRGLDETQQIVQAIETDDVVDAANRATSSGLT